MSREGTGIIGVDEVGRGAWAGPVCVGAVQLLAPIEGLTDSKLLRESQRLTFAHAIRHRAIIGLGWSLPKEIDEVGLTEALRRAMLRALRHFPAEHPVLLDGSHNYLPGRSGVATIVKADLTIPAVSAASIVAKVARDNLMKCLALRYPAYGFERHVGYGTAHHIAMLNQHGASLIHRTSFKPVKLEAAT